MEKSLIEFGGWSDGDCILSIGCGAAWWEIKQIVVQEAGELLLLDYNKDVLNRADVEETIEYFENQAGIRLSTPVQIIHADASAIPLEDESIDQIWLLNSLHEMDEPLEVLNEIDRLLKSDGCIIVEEILSGGVHEGCGKSLFTIDEISELFSQFDFQIQSKCAKDHAAHYVKFAR